MPRFTKTSILTLLLSNLISQERLDLYDSIDWPQAIQAFGGSELSYPNYYHSQNFHGIENGYLNPIAPITYDFVTAIATPPNETRIRQAMLQEIQGNPEHILDLGCGTGTGTLMLCQQFPSAMITGLDLSPYMLVMAAHKAQKANINSIQWQRGLAEATPFASHSFDLITLSMVFHETPPEITADIVAECDRILKPQGQLVILDGHQRKLRHLKVLTQLFREPYSFAYAQGDLQERLAQKGFQRISRQSVGWINQLTSAFKAPLEV